MCTLTLLGCSSNAAKTTPVPGSSATPPVACLPAVPSVALAYPISGSTGVFATVGQLVFQASSSLNLGAWQVRLVPSNTMPVLRGSALGGPPNPLPAPIAALGVGAGNAYFGATVPLLAAGTQYQVQIFMPNLTCLAPLATGVFTTQ